MFLFEEVQGWKITLDHVRSHTFPSSHSLTDINFDRTLMYKIIYVSRLNWHLTEAYLRCSIYSLDGIVLSILSVFILSSGSFGKCTEIVGGNFSLSRIHSHMVCHPGFLASRGLFLAYGSGMGGRNSICCVTTFLFKIDDTSFSSVTRSG